MLFSSPTFLFYFLPLTLLLALLTRRNRVLMLVASLIFYGWGEPIFILLLLFVIVFNYFLGEIIGRNQRLTKLVFISGIGINVAILSVFKYADFVIANINNILADLSCPEISQPHIPLPLGISFFTFQAIAYLSDIYARRISPSHSLLRFAVFKSFFPQLIAGPIVRYQWIADDLKRDHFNQTIFAYGIGRFVIGLAKKVIIADNIAPAVNQIFALPAANLTFASAWMGAIGFTLQIYFDFSGYSDMAIGMGRMFGLHLPENFRHPYIAISVQDFWRRWHITLSTWFRDYLYIPLGGNRRSRFRTYVNLFLVFFLCGLWHGASWVFVVWGLYHGAFLVLERTRFGHLLHSLPRPLAHLYTLAAIIFGWVLFRSPTLTYAVTMIGAMIGRNGFDVFSTTLSAQLSEFNTFTMLIFVAGIVGSLPRVVFAARLGELRFLGVPSGKDVLVVIYPLAMLGLLLASVAFVAAQSHLAFIYFRF